MYLIKRGLPRIVFTLILIFGLVGKVQAAPPLPSNFNGEIHIYDNPPIVGSTIYAYVPGVATPVGTAVVGSSGGNLVYTISVLGDDPDTPAVKEGGLELDLVTFRFGTRALGTAYWHSGTNVRLDFHPPQAFTGGPFSGNEGTTINFTSSSADYGADVATYAWDMDNNGTYEISGQNPSIPWPNSGTFTIGLRVTDAQSGEGYASTTLIVANVAPSVGVNLASVTTSEGTVANNSGTYSDPGMDVSSLTASVGTVTDNGGGAWSWAFTPTDGPAQSQTVTVTAHDADGATGSITFGLVVNNLAPVATLGNNGPVPEGSPVTISFTGMADASLQDVAAGFHYAYACDNGSLAGATYANSSTSSSTTCTFSEPPVLHDVRARIIDKDNGYSEYTTSVIVSNANPVVNVTNATVTVNEGSTAYNSGTLVDPGGDPMTMLASVGTVVNNGDGTWSWSFLTNNGPAQSQTVIIQAFDGQGGFGGVTFALVVNNLPPIVNAGGPYTVNEGSPVNFVGTASDPGTADILDIQWDFNYLDSTFTVDYEGSLTTSVTYSNAGVYTAALRAIDPQLASTIATTTVTILNTPPTNVSAGGPYTVLLGNTLNMTASATCVAMDICTYTWDLDNDGAYDDATGIIASRSWGATGDYTVGVRVTDDEGTYASASTTVHVVTALTQSIPLVVGWNLVSFNLHPLSTDIATVLADIAGHYDLVYAYDSTGAHASSGHWMMYDPSAPFGNTLTTLDETMGFWIHVTTADTLDVVGGVVGTSSIALWDNAYGWNLVGYPSATVRTLPDAITAQSTMVYAYHAAETNPWSLFDRSQPFGNTLTSLTPGWGYWIFVTADNTWSVGY